MKIKLIFIAALLSSLMLTSCSENINNISPVSPDAVSLEKERGVNFPYRNYQEFNELTVKEWVFDPSNGSGEIKVIIELPSKSVNQLFARVELYNGKSDFYYIGKAREEFFMRLQADIREIRTIEVFGMNLIDDVIQYYPYGYMHEFQDVEVKDWRTSRDRLEINHYTMTGEIIHKFVYLQTAEGNIILFVGNPDSNFTIPGYGDKKIFTVTMFGYSRNDSKNISL